MAERTYNIAVIGYGLSSKVFMIPFLTLDASRLHLYAIVQRNPTNDNDAQEDHPAVKLYRSSEEMFKDKAIDVVIVATPPPSHFRLCKQALEAGKHVVCEKPFTMNTEEAHNLIALAADKKLALTVFHIFADHVKDRRWDSDFFTISEILHKNVAEVDLGRIAEFESHFDWHAPLPRPGWEFTWRTQAGTGSAVLYDLGSHLIDQVLQLFGMPQLVTGFLYHQRENGAQWGDADSMTVLMQYDNGGPFVTLKASIMNAEPEQLRFWVRGTKGSYKKYHLDVQEPQIIESHTPATSDFGKEPESHYGVYSTINQSGNIASGPFSTLTPPTYMAFWKQLTQALDGAGAVPVEPESAARVIRIIELVARSAVEQKSIQVV